MKLFLAIAISIFSCSSAFAGFTTFSNECPHDMWVALGYGWGGGSDEPGAIYPPWAKKRSTGWFRVGPYKDESLGFANVKLYAFVQTEKGKLISKVEAKEPKGNSGRITVAHFCHGKGKFDYTLDNNDGPVQFAADCKKEGGSNVVPYQGMFDKSDYTKIRLTTCD